MNSERPLPPNARCKEKHPHTHDVVNELPGQMFWDPNGTKRSRCVACLRWHGCWKKIDDDTTRGTRAILDIINEAESSERGKYDRWQAKLEGAGHTLLQAVADQGESSLLPYDVLSSNVWVAKVFIDSQRVVQSVFQDFSREAKRKYGGSDSATRNGKTTASGMILRGDNCELSGLLPHH